MRSWLWFVQILPESEIWLAASYIGYDMIAQCTCSLCSFNNSWSLRRFSCPTKKQLTVVIPTNGSNYIQLIPITMHPRAAYRIWILSWEWSIWMLWLFNVMFSLSSENCPHEWLTPWIMNQLLHGEWERFISKRAVVQSLI